MRFFVLAFGVLGLGLELLHFAVFKEHLQHPFAQNELGLVLAAGFGIPVLVAIIDWVRPIGAWAFILACACFVAVFVRFEMWDHISRFMALSWQARGTFVAATGGALASIITAVVGDGD